MWRCTRRCSGSSPLANCRPCRSSDSVAAVSCGVVAAGAVLDLDYAEDSQAETDANFVLTGRGGIVEIQATAEGAPFDETLFAEMLRLARAGIRDLTRRQWVALGLGAG